MDVRQWLVANQRKLGSPWERLFVEAVLARVRGLDLADVSAQWEFRDDERGRRYADFVIRNGDDVRLAIEVDGFEAHRTLQQFVNDQRKTQALMRDGWTVLRFANSQFGQSTWRDGAPPEPRERGAMDCARLIELELTRQQRVAAALRQAGSNAALKQQLWEVEQELVRARREKEKAATALTEAAVHNQDLRAALARARTDGNPAETARLADELRAATQLLRQREGELEISQARIDEAIARSGGSGESGQALSQTERDEYQRLSNEAQTRLAELQREVEEAHAVARRAGREAEVARAEATHERNTGTTNMKLALAGIVVVAVVAIGAVAWMGAGSGPEAPPQSSLGSCEVGVSWERGGDCAGQSATVNGVVAGASYQEGVNGQPTYLNLGKNFPSKERFSVVIWGRCRRNFESPPEVTYIDRRIAVTGEVQIYQGVAQMEVCRPSQIMNEGR